MIEHDYEMTEEAAAAVKKASELAGPRRIDTAHLLLALAGQERGMAAQMLYHLGMCLTSVEAEHARIRAARTEEA